MSKDPIKMIDVSPKETIYRTAKATGVIKLKKTTIQAIKEHSVKKGDPLTVGEVAAILGAKKTPELIPLCHNIPLGKIDVTYSLTDDTVRAYCTVTTRAQTGVEMEALVGVTTALLCIWDMVKYLEKDADGQYPEVVITDIRVVEKRKRR